MQRKRKARSGASLIRDRIKYRTRDDPGSAVQHYASLVLRCARDMRRRYAQFNRFRIARPITQSLSSSERNGSSSVKWVMRWR